MSIKLKIGGYEDRRTMAGILADNGYTVSFETAQQTSYNLTAEHYVVIHKAKEAEK